MLDLVDAAVRGREAARDGLQLVDRAALIVHDGFEGLLLFGKLFLRGLQFGLLPFELLLLFGKLPLLLADLFLLLLQYDLLQALCLGEFVEFRGQLGQFGAGGPVRLFLRCLAFALRVDLTGGPVAPGDEYTRVRSVTGVSKGSPLSSSTLVTTAWARSSCLRRLG